MLKVAIRMKISEKQLLDEAKNALRVCLLKAPFVKIRQMKSKDLEADLVVKLELPKGQQTLIIEVKNNGQPRYVREAVNQLVRYLANVPGSYGVFIAPYISPESAQMCENEGIGYVDLAGNCRLSFGTIYIEQKGNPNIFAEKRDLRSLYSPKAERILRVLLTRPGKEWKVKEMAGEAKVSLGQASNVKKLLNDREWLKSSSKGFAVKEPLKLINEWAENYNFRKNDVREFYTVKNIPDIEADIAEICNRNNLSYALTAFSGAARMAPSVRYQRAMIYVEGDLGELVSALELKRVPSGANISLIYPYDEGVFYGAKRIDELMIASPVQTYLDLISLRGRGEEAAEAVLREVILPQW